MHRSTKGFRNKWVRPAPSEAATFTQQPPAAPPPGEKPLKRIGKFALARSPANKQPPAAAPPPPQPMKSSGTDKSRFRYQRTSEESKALKEEGRPSEPVPAAVAVVPPAAAAKPAPVAARNHQAAPPPPGLNSKKKSLTWRNPATALAAKAPTAAPAAPQQHANQPSGSSKPAPAAAAPPSSGSPSVRPGKLRWNKYVRKSLGGGDAPFVPTPAPAAAAAVKKSKRASSDGGKRSGSAVPARAQRAMRLLRLGGRLYSLGQRDKSKSLTLRAVGTPGATAAAAAASIPKPRPDFTTAAAKARKPAALRLPPFSSAAGSSAAAAKAGMAGGKADRVKSRLRGGRVVYCPVYCHTGQCPRRGRGCPLRHDPTKRAVCALWLRGKCALGKACPLQHQRRPELMPTCLHFLQGNCTNPVCPYLHPALRPDAPHCAAFLRGYCAAGVNCASKHFTLKQIKEERRLGSRAQKGAKRGASERKAKDEEAPRPRKKRRRYFDQAEGEEGEEGGEESGESMDSSESESDDDEEEEGEYIAEEGGGSGSSSEEKEEESFEGAKRRRPSLLQDFIEIE